MLQLGDVLWFTTDLDGVKYLLKDPRLEATQAADAHKLKGRQIYRHLVQVNTLQRVRAGWGVHCDLCTAAAWVAVAAAEA